MQKQNLSEVYIRTLKDRLLSHVNSFKCKLCRRGKKKSIVLEN